MGLIGLRSSGFRESHPCFRVHRKVGFRVWGNSRFNGLKFGKIGLIELRDFCRVSGLGLAEESQEG